MRTRLFRRGRPGPSIYLAQSCGNGSDSDVLLLHRAPKYRLAEANHNTFNPKMIGLFNWFNGMREKIILFITAWSTQDIYLFTLYNITNK